MIGRQKKWEDNKTQEGNNPIALQIKQWDINKKTLL